MSTEEEALNETFENINEASEEMKSSNSLTDILNNKMKYAERTVVTYLDYDSAIEAFELQEEIVQLNTLIETTENAKHKSIVDDSVGELTQERDELVDRLAALNDTIQDSRAEWVVTGTPPKVWKTIDKLARQKFPVAKDADSHTKHETQIARNEFVNVETLRQGIKKIVFADGHEVTKISHEEARHMWDNLPVESMMVVKNKIDELSFANRAFQEEIESADFLSNI